MVSMRGHVAPASSLGTKGVVARCIVLHSRHRTPREATPFPKSFRVSQRAAANPARRAVARRGVVRSPWATMQAANGSGAAAARTRHTPVAAPWPRSPSVSCQRSPAAEALPRSARWRWPLALALALAGVRLPAAPARFQVMAPSPSASSSRQVRAERLPAPPWRWAWPPTRSPAASSPASPMR